MLKLAACALLLLQGCQFEMDEESEELGVNSSPDMAHSSDRGNPEPLPDAMIDTAAVQPDLRPIFPDASPPPPDMELQDEALLPPDLEPIEPPFGCEEACLRLSDCAWESCDNPDLNQICLDYCQEYPSIIGALEEESCDELLNLIEEVSPGSCSPPPSDCAQICEIFESCVEMEEICPGEQLQEEGLFSRARCEDSCDLLAPIEAFLSEFSCQSFTQLNELVPGLVEECDASFCQGLCDELAFCATLEELRLCPGFDRRDREEVQVRCMEHCPTFEQPEGLELGCEELVSNVASLDPEFQAVCQGNAEDDCLMICDEFLFCLGQEGRCLMEEPELIFEGCIQRCVEFDQLVESLFPMSCEEMLEVASTFFPEHVELCSPEHSCAGHCDRVLSCADQELGLCMSPIECLDPARCDPEGGFDGFWEYCHRDCLEHGSVEEGAHCEELLSALFSEEVYGCDPLDSCEEMGSYLNHCAEVECAEPQAPFIEEFQQSCEEIGFEVAQSLLGSGCAVLVDTWRSIVPGFAESCPPLEPGCEELCAGLSACVESGEVDCAADPEEIWEICARDCAEVGDLGISFSCESFPLLESLSSEYADLCHPERACEGFCDQALACTAQEEGLCFQISDEDRVQLGSICLERCSEVGGVEEQQCSELLERLDPNPDGLCNEIDSCEEFCAHSEFCLERHCSSEIQPREECVESCAQFGTIWQSFDLACDSMMELVQFQYPDFEELCSPPSLCNGLCDRVIECTEGCSDFNAEEWTQICAEQCGLFESVEIPESCWELREMLAPFVSGLDNCNPEP